MPYRTCPVPAAQHGHAPGQLRCVCPGPATLMRHGHVRYAGVSNWAVWQIVKALGIAERLGLSRFESLHAYYTAAGRDLERKLVPMLPSEGLGLIKPVPIQWRPLNWGRFTRRQRRDWNFRVQAAYLRWLLGQSRSLSDGALAEKELRLSSTDAHRVDCVFSGSLETIEPQKQNGPRGPVFADYLAEPESSSASIYKRAPTLTLSSTPHLPTFQFTLDQLICVGISVADSSLPCMRTILYMFIPTLRTCR